MKNRGKKLNLKKKTKRDQLNGKPRRRNERSERDKTQNFWSFILEDVGVHCRASLGFSQSGHRAKLSLFQAGGDR